MLSRSRCPDTVRVRNHRRPHRYTLEDEIIASELLREGYNYRLERCSPGISQCIAALRTSALHH